MNETVFFFLRHEFTIFFPIKYFFNRRSLFFFRIKLLLSFECQIWNSNYYISYGPHYIFIISMRQKKEPDNYYFVFWENEFSMIFRQKLKKTRLFFCCCCYLTNFFAVCFFGWMNRFLFGGNRTPFWLDLAIRAILEVFFDPFALIFPRLP